jgi:hypothetical protein
MIRLGTWLPFERVPRELASLLGVHVGRETVRRRTEAAGAALVAAEQATVEELGRTWPAPPTVGDTWYQVSVDGAMVPLVHGEWAEVKTLAIGELARAPAADGSWTVQARALSYLSRLADADTFSRAAWGETHRRGITLARHVCAVGDGAAWCQGFYDWHCPDAVRILDWPHAVEYLTAAAHATWGAGTEPAGTWLATTRTELATGTPAGVLARLRRLAGRGRDQRAPLFGRPAGADRVRRVSRRRLSARQRDRGERQQAGGGSAAQRERHALGAGERESDGGSTGRLVQRALDDGLGPAHSAAPGHPRRRPTGPASSPRRGGPCRSRPADGPRGRPGGRPGGPPPAPGSPSPH